MLLKIGIGIAILLAAFPSFAATVPNQLDFPVQYEVMSTIKTAATMVGHFCVMTVRDQANLPVAFVLQKNGFGSCHVWDAGMSIHGRRKKNDIELLVTDDKGKPKIEDWHITATVVVEPNAKPQ